jgi:type VI secretion system protein ImpM
MTEEIAVGFFGKIPSRGDFVRAGLSRDFTLAWDEWLQAVLPACRRLTGEGWDAAWRGTRPWRFTLPVGQCGPRPILGLFLPSVDRAGRCFPLTIAAEGAVDGTCFLDQAEPIGMDAVAGAYAPEGLLAQLTKIAQPCPSAILPITVGRWWRGAGSQAETGAVIYETLPDALALAGMLDP